jgi:hypothetical protein
VVEEPDPEVVEAPALVGQGRVVRDGKQGV